MVDGNGAHGFGKIATALSSVEMHLGPWGEISGGLAISLVPLRAGVMGQSYLHLGLSLGV